jgi:hypothetical protein
MSLFKVAECMESDAPTTNTELAARSLHIIERAVNNFTGTFDDMQLILS